MPPITNRVAAPHHTFPVNQRKGVVQQLANGPIKGPPDAGAPQPAVKFHSRMVHIVLWKWRQPGFRESYTAKQVNICAAMLRRNIGPVLPYRIIVVTDERYGIDAPGVVDQCYDLWTDHDNVANANGQHLPSCYRRLKLFDPVTQAQLDIIKGDRVASLDLDVVVTGKLDGILARREKFVGWGVPGTYHARVFNGSFWMFTAGDLQNLWTEFDPATSPRKAVKSGFLGSDQGWLSMNLARSAEAHGCRWPEIASYPREVRRMRMVHRETRLIFFHGGRKSWHQNVLQESPWIKQYWRA